MKHSFSFRPSSISDLLNNRAARMFSISAACFILASPGAFAEDLENFNRSGTVPVVVKEAPVRYGSGFTPTAISPSSGSDSSNNYDDMSGGAPAPTISSSSSGNSYQANLEVRLSDLEGQMRSLRGQMEEKDHEISQLKDRLDKALSDIDMRLNQGNAGAAMPQNPAPSSSGNLQANDLTSSSVPPQPNAYGAIAADPKAAAPANSPTQQNLGSIKSAPGGASIAPSSGDIASQYESAFSKLKGGDYQNAQIEFDRFLKANPGHPLSANATYWYGETFYAQQKFSEASRIFAESYKKYPKGPKAADSLLKLGMSLGGAGKTKEACVSLKQLKKQYPAGNSTLLHRADQEMSKLACS